jgi:hypothetical protein
MTAGNFTKKQTIGFIEKQIQAETSAEQKYLWEAVK